MVLLEIGIVIIVIVLAAIVLIFNGLIAKKNRVNTAWSQIEVQLKRRYDLIPNLVETVKGYAKYERGVITQVTSLRSAMMTGSVKDRAAASNQLSATLKSIFAVAENYPTLKASDNFKELQEQLETTEDRIAFTRTSYNDYVLDYNNAIQQIPGNIIAPLMGYKTMDLFDVPEGEQGPVKVDMSGLSDDSGSAPAQAPAPAKKSTKKTSS